MELAELKEGLLGYMKDERIVFQQVDGGRMEGVAYSRLSLDPSQPSVVTSGKFEDLCWEVVTIAHEVDYILNFREMERDEARGFFCTMLIAPSLGLERLSGGGQRLTLHLEALASLKGWRS